MTDSLDEIIKRAAAGYNAPPDTDLDAMWRGIESRRRTRPRSHLGVGGVWPGARAAAAAVLLLASGIMMGRASVRPAVVMGEDGVAVDAPDTRSQTEARPVADHGVAHIQPPAFDGGSVADEPSPDALLSPRPMRTTASPAELSQHLREAASVIVEFRRTAGAGLAGDRLIPRSRQVLERTRELEDSIGEGDISLRQLYTDLEFVLAQIAQYVSIAGIDRTELDLIEDSIRRRQIFAQLESRAPARHEPDRSEESR